MTAGTRALARWRPAWLAGALVLAAVGGTAHSAAAHGQHAAAGSGPPAGVVAVGDYRVELLIDPAPLAVGREGRVIAKITRVSPPAATVSGGTVRIGLAADAATSATAGATAATVTPAATIPPAATTPAVLKAAPEMTWAGHYTAAFTPARSGRHRVTVVIEQLEARRFDPPLAVELQIPVGRAHGALWPTLTAVAIAGVLGGACVYGLHRRAATSAAGGPLNLFDIAWVRRVLTSSAVKLTLQITALAVTTVIVVLGLIDVQDGGTNLATKLTWTIWWAGIIFTFVLAGRIWCVACPVGALNEWTSRATRAWRRLPRPFRNIWWATALFVVLTWTDEQLGVVRWPRVTAWLVIGFVAIAVLVGLRYERRSFCRYLCPIGGLIGIYSMVAPVELRARDGALCRGHRDKECFKGTRTARGCPMLEFPQAMDRNNYCTLCAECVVGCSRENLALRVRAVGKDLWTSSRRVLDEAYLAVALVGLTLLVTAEMLSAWPTWISTVARWLPPAIRTHLKPVTYLSLVESVLLLGGSLVVGPLLVLAAAALSERLAGDHAMGLRRTFVTFAYMFVPVGLAMHLAHNLSHLLLEGGGIVPVVQRAATLYGRMSLGEPDWQVGPLVAAPVVSLLQMAIVLGFFLVSLVAGHRLSMRVHAEAKVASRALVPFAVLVFVFTAIGLALLNQSMGLRHGMS